MKRYSKLLFPALLLFAAFHVSTAWAQKKYDEQKAEITKVKRAPEKYVYAEATCKTLEEAKDVAEEMFYEAVNEYVAELKKEKGKNDFVINDAKAIFNEISMPRGSNMQRVFLYAKKSDIIAMKNPVVLSKMNKEEEVTEKSQPSESEPTPAPQTIEFPPAAKQLATIKTIAEANRTLKQMKASGTVIAYSKYSAVTNANEWYLIVYDAKGNVKAILTDGEKRYNVATGFVDSFSNYPQHVAFAVKIKK